MNGEEHPFSFLRHEKVVNRVQLVNGFPLLQPKIHAVLRQTRPQERDDLKQEFYLMIIQTIQTKKFKEAPSFCELVETEKLAQNEL